MLYIASSYHFINCVKKIQPKGGNLLQKVMNNYKHLANSQVVVLKALPKIGLFRYLLQTAKSCAFMLF